MEIRQYIRTGHLAGLVSSHPVGNGYGEAVGILRQKLSGIYVATYKLIKSKDHVFVVISDTSYTACSRQCDSTHDFLFLYTLY